MYKTTTDPAYEKAIASSTAFYRLLSWFFLAALAFIGVVFLSQLLIGAASFTMGYETRIHFGKVDSLPPINRFWSGSRVLLLYAAPSVGLILFSSALLTALLFMPKSDFRWRWAAFWVVVFSTLMGTTLLSISLISALTSKGSLYQGFAVVTSWYGLSTAWSIAFITLSGTINILFGFFCAPVLLALAPPDFIIRKERNSYAVIILNTFVYPILFLIPLAFLLSYPGYLSFFAIMFCHTCLWFPGLFAMSRSQLKNRRSRGKTSESYSSKVLLGIMLLLVIIIRLFFA